MDRLKGPDGMAPWRRLVALTAAAFVMLAVSQLSSMAAAYRPAAIHRYGDVTYADPCIAKVPTTGGTVMNADGNGDALVCGPFDSIGPWGYSGSDTIACPSTFVIDDFGGSEPSVNAGWISTSVGGEYWYKAGFWASSGSVLVDGPAFWNLDTADNTLSQDFHNWTLYYQDAQAYMWCDPTASATARPPQGELVHGYQVIRITKPNASVDLRHRPGDFEVYGGPGTFTVHLGSGAYKVHGGPGRNIISGGSGINWIYGGPHDDLIHTGTGHSIVITGNGNSKVFAANGKLDEIECGTGHTVVYMDRTDLASKTCIAHVAQNMH